MMKSSNNRSSRDCGCHRQSMSANSRPIPNQSSQRNGCGSNNCMERNRNTAYNSADAERLLTLIRRLDFVLVETNLYLDTHPCDRTAISYFERALREREQAATKYEKMVGPLTAAGNRVRDVWLWSTESWPWQTEYESRCK